MTLPGTSQGSERPGQWGQPQVDKGGFQVSWWMVRTLGAVDVPHHVIQTTSPCRLGLNGVVSRGRNLRPCHESNVELGCFCVMAIVNSAAVKTSTSVFFRYHFLRIYDH